MIWQRNGSTTRPDHAPNAALEALRNIESRVRPDFRKTVVFGVIALAAVITGPEIGGVHAASMHVRIAAYGCAVLVAVFGIAASQTAGREVQRIATHRAGVVAATPLRITVLLVGYLFAAIAVCDLLDINVGHLLVGGAITGIVLGLAAQPVLGNLFAGLVLLFARPYLPGQRVRVLSGAINGPHEGVIISAGLLYTMLQTADGPLNIPNSTLLASAIGPAATPPIDISPVDSSPIDSSPADSSPADMAQDSRNLATAVAEGVAADR
jgi:small-conductance mechanosensitive channel